MGGVILWGFRKRGRIMYEHEKVIRFTAMEDVNEFVTAAGQCDFDIDVNYNRVIIDAKSILGVLGLDLGRVLTVTCHGESQKFDNFLQQYAVA